MSGEMEKVFAELHKVMEGKEFKNKAEFDAFVGEFMEKYNAKVGKKT